MRYPIPAQTRTNQRRASDPEVSAWVSAHAGSGKTHVLTQRVVRLLLAGVAPSRLICLTFTKAAAANMSARVFGMLAGWTLADDETLRAKIEETGARPPRNLDDARKLFAAAVETPGGLKIQTIHAFCERVLHLFPFEANVPAEFRAAEDLERAELLALARRETFAAAANDAILGAALARVAEETSEGGFETILNAALAQREALDDVETLIARLPAALELSSDDDEASIRRAIVEDGIHWSEWRAIAVTLEGGSANDKKQALKLRQAAERAPDSACIEDYFSLFFTQKGAPLERVATNNIAKIAPDLPRKLIEEGQRLLALRDKLRVVWTLDRTIALLRLAAACLQRYEALKRTHGVLDFDDLIERTRALLTREGAAAWTLYKLDRGVDHILVDEAQDTSEAQWAILEALASEFTSGAGARLQRRTFFAVGDEKQSIFSFQGASPQSFGRMRNLFRARVEAADQTFDPVPLELSFRSARNILDAVDLVFSSPEARKGLNADPQEPPPRHSALKHDIPGMVEIWEPIAGSKQPDPAEWTLPLDLPRETSPPAELAERIAAKIKAFIGPASRERVHDSQSGALRPIRPGDVMILVRRRDAFFEAMVRALKAKGVPVAGADRLEIASHIAVMDLLAAARVALAPQDDYALACALKSPLIGLDDSDLIEVAPHRPGSLDAALRASPESRHARAAQKIARWRDWAKEARPFEFFSRLLGEDGGRRAFLARLGAEAGDAIDEFMSLALDHDRNAAPSLAAFIHEVETLELTVKRDMESADVVRVMTVHAAKGLEAKVVFLPDTCALPPASKNTLFSLPGNAGAALAWSPRKDEDAGAVANCRERAVDEVGNEYRRLLYVAMTRAEERLYVCGHYGLKKKPTGCWYDLVVAGLDETLADIEDETAPGGRVRRFGAPSVGDEGALFSRAETTAAPDWLFAQVAREREAPPPLRPSSALSGADGFEGPMRASGAITSSGVIRGLLVHQLLQSLPTIAEGQRAAAALRYLRTQAPGMSVDAHAALTDEVLHALALAEAAPLFSANSRAEVTIAARIPCSGGSPIEIAGRIDRLAEVGAEIWIADFKTGAPPGETPSTYVAQLALYGAAVRELYPDRSVRAFILWTATPRLQEIPAVAMEAALAAL